MCGTNSHKPSETQKIEEIINKYYTIFHLKTTMRHNTCSETQKRLDEMTRVSSNLTKVLGSNLALGMQQC